MRRDKNNTSWQNSATWYNKITGDKGHYYHEHVVLPETLKLLNLKPGDKLLDLACGNGVLGRQIPRGVEYTGVDIADALIRTAKKMDTNLSHEYVTGDVTRNLSIDKKFTHATIILALQNIKFPEKAIDNVSRYLSTNGILVMVLNHPSFRIPRQSSWEIDGAKKTQFRRIDKYMSQMSIPINTNPSDRNSAVTWSYHFPISDYSHMLKDSGLLIESIEEWTSDKESEGRSAKMENRSRSEFPLFMAIVARKI